ncbi:AAA family ATPase [Actinomyces capricornis]|uniref:Transporter n=1 Tax=Actinomyces capricornis TaxID=2755559 RepID=A0ABM7U9W9_9ACTO|nr:ATP-binding protein [Actinomyces capricornis]BDA64168.1 transporter [Actinomyces capricornis]
MLRFLRLENWKSYYEPVEFSMVATRERRHGERLAAMRRSRILPVAAVYGANASGKSTLVDGLEALRNLVLDARPVGGALRMTPHLIKGRQEPTVFTIEFVAPDGSIQEHVFLYEVVADRRRIHRESLVLVKSQSEEVVFEREGDEIELYGDLVENRRAQAYRTVVAPNETFLGVLGVDGDTPVAVARRWFEQCLTIIRPGSEYVHLPARLDADEMFAQAMNEGLTRADTGISRLDLEDMRVNALSLKAEQIDALIEMLQDEGGTVVIGTGDRDWALLSLSEEGEPMARRLVTLHEVETGPGEEERASFRLHLREESDGTQRFMNLLPVLFQLRKEDARGVFVIDELENSMHPRLTQEFIRSFLDGLDAHDRRQLIFTTHEIQLMRSDLLRRDEIWVADKVDGDSRLTRVSDFAGIGVRKDADLLSFYMSGRIGGVPRI